jgi:hypothetical protein
MMRSAVTGRAWAVTKGKAKDASRAKTRVWLCKLRMDFMTAVEQKF